MTAASGEPFASIRRHKYTRLPVAITGVGGSISLRYDSFGRRLHKTGAQAIFYRNGAHHPASDRTKELEKGNEIHHTLVELVDGTEIVYIFTPVGQSVTRRKDGYTRIACDHLRSVRVERSSAAQITAHYSAYGKSIITGGQLRRAFAGYEPDAETGLYNAHRRLYAPTLRLFVSVDPRLQNASPYPYCNNDPFNKIDPTGEISAATVGTIVSALVIVAAIVISIFLDATTFELIPVFSIMVPTGPASSASGVAVSAYVAMYAKVGAVVGAATSIVSNSAKLAVKAAQGEHITAWQAVRSMLIEPVIAAMAGAAAGASAGVGLSSGAGGVTSQIPWVNPFIFTLGMTAAGGALAGGVTSVANTALDGTIATRSGWEQTGIQMAIAAGEALTFMLFHFGAANTHLWNSYGWNKAFPSPAPKVKTPSEAPAPPLAQRLPNSSPAASAKAPPKSGGGARPPAHTGGLGQPAGPFANPFGDSTESYQDSPS